MLGLLFNSVCCKRPIIMFPPLYGSNMKITYKNISSLHSYCPQKQTNKLIWVNPKFVVPPLYNCLFQLLQVYWDDERETYKSIDNATIFVEDFGGEQSVKYIAHATAGISIIESFKTLITHLRHEGYVMHKDMFAAPFDWRFAVAGLQDYYPMAKQLIRHAYRVNGNEKVILFGFSCGGYVLQQLLAKHLTQEFKDKYIDRVIFLAPSFGGAGASLPSLWNQIFPIVPIIKNDDLSKMIESMAVIHQHLPNWQIFKGEKVVRDPNGRKYYVENVGQFLMDNGKLSGDNVKIHYKATNISSEAPHGPGLPTLIIFNSAIKTDFDLDFKNGWEKSPTVGKTEGDGTVFARGHQYACQKWAAPIKCIDLDMDSPDFEHQPLASNPYVMDLISQHIKGDRMLTSNERELLIAPWVTITSNGTYSIDQSKRSFERVNAYKPTLFHHLPEEEPLFNYMYNETDSTKELELEEKKEDL